MTKKNIDKAIVKKKSAPKTHPKIGARRQSELDKVDSHKKGLITALNEYKGIVSTACDSIGLSRTTFYNYVNDDPEFAKEVENCQERAIDFVEGKLFEKINGVTIQSYNSKGDPVIYDQAPSDTAIIFYLKTKGKKRGYVEKQEVEHSGSIITWNEEKTYEANPKTDQSD